MPVRVRGHRRRVLRASGQVQMTLVRPHLRIQIAKSDSPVYRRLVRSIGPERASKTYAMVSNRDPETIWIVGTSYRTQLYDPEDLIAVLSHEEMHRTLHGIGAPRASKAFDRLPIRDPMFHPRNRVLPSGLPNWEE